MKLYFAKNNFNTVWSCQRNTRIDVNLKPRLDLDNKSAQQVAYERGRLQLCQSVPDAGPGAVAEREEATLGAGEVALALKAGEKLA